jgi:hypothetical protein
MALAGAAAGAVGKSGIGKLISGAGGIGGLLSIGSSVAGLLGGIGQKKRGKEAMAQAELLNPGVEGYQSISNEAQQAAREGMGAQEYNLASTNIQRGTASSLGAAGRLGNPIAAISNIQRNQNDAFGQLDASNYGLKRQNRQASWAAQAQLQQARQQQYSDAYNAAQALMGAGQQNTAGSLGALGQFGLMQSVYGDRTQYANKNRNKTAAAAATPTTTPAATPVTTPSYSVPGMPSFMQGKFGGYMGGGYYGKINPLTGLPY